VHHSGYKEYYNDRVIPKFDHTMLSRGRGDWADAILAQIKRFATRKRLSVDDLIYQQDRYETGFISYQDFSHFLHMCGCGRIDAGRLSVLQQELDTVLDQKIDLDELTRRINGKSKVSVLAKIHRLSDHWSFPIFYNIKLWTSANDLDLYQLFGDCDLGASGTLATKEFVRIINEK
jgi:hypothetical protein